MAKSYDLPSLVSDTGFGDDVKGGLEDTHFTANQFIGMTAYTDIITGMGCVDDAKGISFEQLVIDSYMWDFFRDFMKEIEITEDKMGFETIKNIGHGGDFLTSDHTIKYLRSDLTQWDRAKLDLLALEKTDMPREANRIARQILADHQVPALDEAVIREGDRIIKDYEREVSGT